MRGKRHDEIIWYHGETVENLRSRCGRQWEKTFFQAARRGTGALPTVRLPRKKSCRRQSPLSDGCKEIICKNDSCGYERGYQYSAVRLGGRRYLSRKGHRGDISRLHRAKDPYRGRDYSGEDFWPHGRGGTRNDQSAEKWSSPWDADRHRGEREAMGSTRVYRGKADRILRFLDYRGRMRTPTRKCLHQYRQQMAGCGLP